MSYSILSLACENSRFSSLFAAGDVSRFVFAFLLAKRPTGEERGEKAVFAGYPLIGKAICYKDITASEVGEKR